MDIIRINAIDLALLGKSDLDFIDSTDSDLFVELSEGDASRPLSLDQDSTFTLKELVGDEYAKGCYVAFSSLDSDNDEVAAALIKNGWEETKSYFSGDRYFSPLG